jgi:serine phosphatase RsbU (regulator of sigma subunit)
MSVINHLSLLESAGLVSLTQVMPDVEYLFRHTLVQEAAYASLLEADQKNLHRRVGEAIELLYPDQLDEIAPSLARHFEQAGDFEKAALYFEKAGKHALGSYAHQEAANHFKNALRYAKHTGQKAVLLSGLGEAFSQMGQTQEAIQVWKDGIEKFVEIGDRDNTARLYARAGRAAWFINDPRLGLRLCQEGLAAIENAPESYGVALLLHETGRAYFFNGEQTKALPLCRQALEMAQRLGAVDVQADSLTTMGILPAIEPEERQKLLESAVELAESAGLLNVASRAHLNLGSAKMSLHGDMEGGKSHFLRAAELAQRCGAIQNELFYRNSAVSIAMEMGDLDEVEHTIPTLEKLAQSLPDQSIALFELNLLKLMPRAYRGHWSEVIPVLKDNLQQARRSGNLQNQINLTTMLSSAVIANIRLGNPGDLDEIAETIDAALVLTQEGKVIHSISHLLCWAAMIKAYQGDFKTAHQLMHQVRQEIAQKTDSKHIQMVNFAKLEIAFRQGHWAEVISTFTEITADHKGLDKFAWGGLLILTAEAHLKRSEPDDLEQAQTLLQEAGAVFTKLQAPVYLEKVEELVKASRLQTFAQAEAQRQVARELAQAGRLQSSFLPEEPPVIPGWQVAAVLRPVRQTTGDYYDFIPLSDGRMGIVIADVADKGIGAALFMASSRSLLRAYVAENADAPEKVLLQANQRITQDTHGGLFITLFYGVLNPQTGELVYCNAGHNPPYLLDPSGETHRLPKTGVPLGIFPDASWQNRRAVMNPGARLALYTDGVTEAVGPDEQLFGEERLIEALKQSTPALTQPDAAQIMQSVLQKVDEFRGQVQQADDLTLVVVTRS